MSRETVMVTLLLWLALVLLWLACHRLNAMIVRRVEAHVAEALNTNDDEPTS